MKTIETYQSYNHRRYGTPWVAIINPATAKPDFSRSVGGYTGANGSAGDLYVTDPQDGAVYMHGQKDYRGGNTQREYHLYVNGEFVPISDTQLLQALRGEIGGEEK